MLKRFKLNYKLKIYLLINWMMFNREHWMIIENYMLFKFLYKVKAL